MSQTAWREPIEFAAGDTLSFSRSLPDYPAPGWALTYELRGQAQPIEFASTASGADHALSVDAATTATWLPGEYVLAGYAIKGAERHQIYYGSLTVTPNLPATAGDEPQKTFAQQMVEKLESVMLGKADDDLLQSRIGDTQFQYLTPEQLRTEHGYWTEVRRNEIAKQRAKAGRPTGNKIRLRMNVSGTGAVLGSGVYPYSR